MGEGSVFAILTLVLLVVYSLPTYLTIIFPIPGLLVLLSILIVTLVLVQIGTFPPFRQKAFGMIKLASLAAGMTIPTLVILNVLPVRFVAPVMMFMLILNMSEAVFFDYKNKNYYNVIAGLLLIVIALFCLDIQWLGFYYAGFPPSLIFWILGFTLWNWNFFLFIYDAKYSYYNAMILSGPLVVVLFTLNPSLWLIARVISAFLGATLLAGVGKIYILPYVQFKRYEVFCDKLKSNKFWQAIYCYITISLGLLTLAFHFYH